MDLIDLDVGRAQEAEGILDFVKNPLARSVSENLDLASLKPRFRRDRQIFTVPVFGHDHRHRQYATADDPTRRAIPGGEDVRHCR